MMQPANDQHNSTQITETRRKSLDCVAVLARLAVPSVLIGLLVAGCIPAETPPQLDHTPGPPFVITDATYTTPHYRVTYPPGWRVTTGAAADDPHVIFIAPGNCALIVIAVGGAYTPEPLGCADATTFETESRRLNGDGQPAITASLVAPAESWAAVAPVFEAVIESAVIVAADS